MRIALFITCVNDTLFPDAGKATARVLQRLGHSVELPESGCASADLPARADEPPLSLAELDGRVAVLTGYALAIALTGTVVLDGGPGQGRRALSLVPDVHVCVVPTDA